MLVCSVVLRPKRGALAATILETATAIDAPSLGAIFATLTDNPGNALDILDAFSGQRMVEAASANAVTNATLPQLVAAAMLEQVTTTASTQDATAAGSAWTPASLGSALRAWYQMDLLAGSNGSTITSVTDSSGNGFNLTNVGTPTLAAAHQNSKNTARMPGATSYFNMSSSVMAGSAAGSVYIVYKGDATGTNYTMMNIGSAGGDSHWPYSDNAHYNNFGSDQRKNCGTATNSVTSYRIVSIYSKALDWAFYIDGGTGGSTGGTSPLFATTSTAVGWWPSTVKIGANDTASTFLTGHIAEMFFTNAKQTTTDRQKAEGYLAHKWGITGNLSASHPYKSSPP